MDSLPLFTIVVPAVIAGILWGIDWRIWSREAPSLRWLHALAIPAAFIVAFTVLWGWPGIRPLLAEGWLWHVAVLGAVTGILQPRICKTMPWVLWIWSDLFLMGNIGHFPAGTICGLLLLFVHFNLERIASHRSGASLPLALWVWAAGSALALASTGSIKYGQLAGIIAATLGAGVVVAWIKPRFSLAQGALNALLPLMFGVLLCGTLYSELPLSCAILLSVAPLMIWLGELNAVKNRSAWLGVTLRALAVAIPVGIAVLIACWPMLFAAKGSSDF